MAIPFGQKRRSSRLQAHREARARTAIAALERPRQVSFSDLNLSSQLMYLTLIETWNILKMIFDIDTPQADRDDIRRHQTEDNVDSAALACVNNDLGVHVTDDVKHHDLDLDDLPEDDVMAALLQDMDLKDDQYLTKVDDMASEDIFRPITEEPIREAPAMDINLIDDAQYPAMEPSNLPDFVPASRSSVPVFLAPPGGSNKASHFPDLVAMPPSDELYHQTSFAASPLKVERVADVTPPNLGQYRRRPGMTSSDGLAINSRKRKGQQRSKRKDDRTPDILSEDKTGKRTHGRRKLNFPIENSALKHESGKFRVDKQWLTEQQPARPHSVTEPRQKKPARPSDTPQRRWSYSGLRPDKHIQGVQRSNSMGPRDAQEAASRRMSFQGRRDTSSLEATVDEADGVLRPEPTSSLSKKGFRTRVWNNCGHDLGRLAGGQPTHPRKRSAPALLMTPAAVSDSRSTGARNSCCCSCSASSGVVVAAGQHSMGASSSVQAVGALAESEQYRLSDLCALITLAGACYCVRKLKNVLFS